MQDVPTPDEIENASFPDGEFGYDRSRVDSFLRTVAREMRRLQRDLELASERNDAPYRAAGKEIGDLVQQAKEMSRQLVDEAEDTAARILHSARRESDARAKEAAAVEQEGRRAADRMVSEARVEATELVARARRMKSRAEAEARIVVHEGEREARLLKQQAKNEAGEIRASAEQKHRDLIAQLERRIRSLRETEAALARRVQGLKAQHDASAEDAAQEHAADLNTAEPHLR